MYDTRLYTRVYNHIVVDTVIRQRKAGIDTTGVAARSAMSRDFVTFFEKDVPMIVTSIIGIVGSAVILFAYDLIIGAITALLFVPVVLVNRLYGRRSLKLNEGLNDQLEEEVRVIDMAEPEGIRRHFEKLRVCRVKLSDAEAYNWTFIEVLSIAVFIVVLARARLTFPRLKPAAFLLFSSTSGASWSISTTFRPSSNRRRASMISADGSRPARRSTTSEPRSRRCTRSRTIQPSLSGPRKP